MAVRSGAQETRKGGGWLEDLPPQTIRAPKANFECHLAKNGPETEVWRFGQFGAHTSQAPSAEGGSWGQVGAAGPQPTPKHSLLMNTPRRRRCTTGGGGAKMAVYAA